MHPDHLVLNTGAHIPIIGFGTWQIQGEDAFTAVSQALKAGYRHIDTAKIYDNEEHVGRAIVESGIPRHELFITTKLWNADHVNPMKALDKSLAKLKVDYIDLYLMHFPVQDLRLKTWAAMEQMLASKKVRAIGVSNFTIRHLKELLAVAKVKPAVNQIELSPYLYQKELIDFCNKHDIVIEAYSPLTRGEKLQDPPLVAIAKKYGKTPAQILIRWCVQKHIVVLPKSVTQSRIKENIEVFGFSIDKDDMDALDELHTDLRLCWDPSEVP